VDLPLQLWRHNQGEFGYPAGRVAAYKGVQSVLEVARDGTELVGWIPGRICENAMHRFVDT